MFCPKCGSEFVADVVKCPNCRVDLVSDRPSSQPVGQQGREALPGPLERLPLSMESDTTLIQSLLAAHGFEFMVTPGFGEVPDEILVRKNDLPRIKRFLEEYRSEDEWGRGPSPIEW